VVQAAVGSFTADSTGRYNQLLIVMKNQFSVLDSRGERQSASGFSSGLPTDLMEDAAQRLGLAALMYAGAYAVAFSMAHLSFNLAYHPYHLLSVIICLVAVGVSLGVYFAVRSGWLKCRAVVDLGLAYWIFGALAIDADYYTGIQEQGYRLVGISWVCVWLVVFPMIVPNRPRKVLVAALIAASMGPLGFLIAFLTTGEVPVRDFNALYTFFPYYLCAGLAYVGARIVHKMGTAVREAREMGSYKLISRIGSGGMGEVWLAKHHLLARPAAVKFVRLGQLVSNPGSAEGVNALLSRFEREAQATAALHCAHTIDLYDFGVTEDGTFYYAMEYLEGLTAQSLVERFGPLPVNRLIFLLKQVCESLADAHYAGLVHRDVKPANVFVSRFGRKCDFVKVLDFGLVKARGDFGENDGRLTQAGTITGTPAYLAPEVAMGYANVDARADIYSLGCTAYWMLTGKAVFEGKTGMEVIVQHMNSHPKRPSEVLGQPLPEKLEDLLLACLVKEPGKRVQTVDEIVARLNEIQLPDPWTFERAAEWWESHQLVGKASELPPDEASDETVEARRSHVSAFRAADGYQP